MEKKHQDDPFDSLGATGIRGPDDDSLDALGTSVKSTAEIEDLRIGDVFAGRYEILSKGLKGGMGVVYKSKDKKLDRTKALKVMHPRLLSSDQALQRFRQEVSISQSLQHKNIVRVYDLDDCNGIEFFTMEWVDGRSLRDIIAERKKENRPFTLEETNRIIIQLCDALSHAHKHTVHRDIKPENIMVCEGEEGIEVKLTDFGIAKMLTPSNMMATSAQIGTPYYMAPEQKSDAAHVDKRADIYAMGIVLFELLTFENTIGLELPSEMVTGLPKEIDDIVKKAVATKPEGRYGDIRELSEALNRLARTTGKGTAEEEFRAPEATKAKEEARVKEQQVPLKERERQITTPTKKSSLSKILPAGIGILAVIIFGVIYLTSSKGPKPEKLEAEINVALKGKGLANVQAKVDKDLTAILQGSTNNPAEKQMALDTAKSYKDLKMVTDNIQIKQPPPGPMQKIDTAKLEVEINRALKGKGLASAYISVNEDLTATLLGFTNNSEEKTMAFNIARSYKDLKGLTDNIQVKPPQPSLPEKPVAKADPAKVEGEINQALRDKGLKSVHAEVSKDLVGTLAGSVDKAEDRTVALDIARSHKELKDLKDNIQVKAGPAQPPEKKAILAPPSRVPFPDKDKLAFVDPNPKFGKEIAAFSGLWEGAWDGTIPCRLAVEKINLKEATVVYGMAEDPKGTFRAGWTRTTANLLSTDTLQWGGGNNPKLTFRVGQDLRTLLGKYEFKGDTLQVTMSKGIESQTFRQEPSTPSASYSTANPNSKKIGNIVVTVKKIMVSNRQVITPLELFNQLDKELKIAMPYDAGRGNDPRLMDEKGNNFEYKSGIPMHYLYNSNQFRSGEWLTLNPKSNNDIALVFGRNFSVKEVGSNFALSLKYTLYNPEEKKPSDYSASFTEIKTK